MISIIDYGMGNLKNIYKALKYVNADCKITSNPIDVLNSDAIVLPGVGGFKDAVSCLRLAGLEDSIKTSVKQGKPFLGICLGMQMLFDYSYENGKYTGLSLMSGEVRLIETDKKIPHIGWNSLDITNMNDPLFDGIIETPVVYFVHSYHCMPENIKLISSISDYGSKITASVYAGNIHGVQFHPEKSGNIGLKILNNFRRLVK